MKFRIKDHFFGNCLKFREEAGLPLQKQDGFNGSKYVYAILSSWLLLDVTLNIDISLIHISILLQVNPRYLASHSITERRKRLSIHYEDLEDCYFSIKQSGN